MDEDFIRNRITQLRLQRNISEYKLSMDLGHSKGYIQSISSGRALPSMSEFLYICDYFGITPADFFDCGKDDVIAMNELCREANSLSPSDMELLIQFAKRLNSQK